MAPRRAERSARGGAGGFATVLTTAWMLLLVLMGTLATTIAVAVARQHQVDGAADLAALAAAAARQHGRAPCPAAARLAAANAVRLTDCRSDGADVLVTVQARLSLPFGWHADIGGRARAGPA